MIYVLSFLSDMFPKAWVSSEHKQIHWGAQSNLQNISHCLRWEQVLMPSSFCDDSHNWHSRATATHQPLHEAFWNMSVLRTISWKHLKPQENVLKIQVPLHVTCVLRQANSLIPPQAGPELWSQLLAMLCGLFKVSRRADTICNSSVFPTQTTPAVFLGLSSFSAAVSFKKCWRALKCHTTTVLSAAPFCVFRKPDLHIFRGAKNTPQTCGDDTARAYNCECLQAYCEEPLAWVRERKKRWDTFWRADWCWCSSSAPLTFLRPKFLSVTCTAQDLWSLLLLLFVHKAGT